jgi:hypothetical protein
MLRGFGCATFSSLFIINTWVLISSRLSLLSIIVYMLLYLLKFIFHVVAHASSFCRSWFKRTNASTSSDQLKLLTRAVLSHSGKYHFHCRFLLCHLQVPRARVDQVLILVVRLISLVGMLSTRSKYMDLMRSI